MMEHLQNCRLCFWSLIVGIAVFTSLFVNLLMWR